MSYLANQTRVASLTIGGVDYTSSLVEFVVSDETAYKNGALQTSGTLTLGSYAGGPAVEDYDRDNFRRGAVVTLDLTEPGGSPYRHPRGYLYVISSTYDVENEQLVINLGCRLVLISITEEIDDLVAIVPVTLDVAQTTYPNCSAAFASAGKYVYQDNTGALQVGTFFDGDGYSGVAAGEWISVLGVTTTSVQPLAGTNTIPDSIKLSYQVPIDGLNVDNKGRVDTVQTDSYYFLRYPAVAFVRKGPPGGLSLVNSVRTGTAINGSTSVCGNTPNQPASNGTGGITVDSCNGGYQTEQEQVFIPAIRRETSITEYDGPGAQVSRTYTETRAPAVEANSQYYGDKYAYCRATWSTDCQPNGNCPFEGLNEILLAYVETINYYGNSNELVRRIQDTYATTLSAAQTSDWRSGINQGVAQDFNPNLSTTSMYRTTRIDTKYYQEGSTNVQEDVTFTSAASRGSGLSGVLDALKGIKTKVVRKSTTSATVEIAPDRINSAVTSTKEERTDIPIFVNRFKTPPNESGPYILEEQIPVPLLFANRVDIDNSVTAYSNYIERFVKGDAFGLSIGESMRSDVVTNWKPGMPFRYYDAAKNTVLALRMDATSWGVNQQECSFVTNGVWIGFSNGTVTVPENLVGNSLPDMGSGTTSPPAVVPPSISNETNVDSGPFSWNINVSLGFSVNMKAWGLDGLVPLRPSDLNYNVYRTMTSFVEGLVVGPGDLLSTGANGTIPLENAGSLVVVDATIVDADVFA